MSEKKSKLKSFEPKMKDGSHETWSNDNRIYYKFIVTLENGDSGECSSTKQTPSWKIGEEYTYNFSINGNYTNIRKFKAVNTGGGYRGGGSRDFESKEERAARQRAIVLQSSISNTINFYGDGVVSIPREQFFGKVDDFYKYVVENSGLEGSSQQLPDIDQEKFNLLIQYARSKNAEKVLAVLKRIPLFKFSEKQLTEIAVALCSL